MNDQEGFLSGFLENYRNRLVAKYAYGKLLDVGCNTGSLRKFLPENTKYFGIDIHNREDLKPDFGYAKADIEKKIPLKEKFDTAALVAVIEHLRRPKKALENISKIIKKGGLVIITTPTKSGDNVHKFLSKMGFVSSFAAQDHQHIFELEELKQLTKESGFGIVDAKTFQAGFNQIVVGKKI